MAIAIKCLAAYESDLTAVEAVTPNGSGANWFFNRGREWQPVGGSAVSSENKPLYGPRRRKPGPVNTGENLGLPPAEGARAKENPGALAGATGVVQDSRVEEGYPGAGASESPSEADLLRQVVAANLCLGLSGFQRWVADDERIDPGDPDLVRQFTVARAWISRQPRRRAMFRQRTSYGLKHLLPSYAYSGTFIAAAISLGLPYERRWDIGGDVFLPIWPSRKGGRA